MKKNKRVLVTGAAGFIGCEVARQCLAAGYRVWVLDNLCYAADRARLKAFENKIEFIRADICDRRRIEGVFKRGRFGQVLHLAAQTHVDRSILESEDFIQTNFAGTQVLLEAARKYPVQKFVHISTDEVYGEIAHGSFREDHPLSPNSPYSASKAAGDLLVQSYRRTYGLPVATVRPSNNYGPWQYPEKFIPVVIYKALTGQKVPIYARGQNVREWIYVRDTAEGILRVMTHGQCGQAYNLGSGMERKNIDVAHRILDLLGKPRTLIEYVKDRPGHDLRYRLDSRKIQRRLGWEVRTDFETGLAATVAWYRDHFDWVESKAKKLQSYWKRVYQKA